MKRGLCRRLAARGGGDCAVDSPDTCTSPGSPPSPSRVPASGTASASESVTASKRACCNDDRDGNWTYCRRYAGGGKRSRERRGLAGQAEWFKRKTGAQEVSRTPREASEAQGCSVQHCRPGAFSNPLPLVQQITWRPPGTQWVSCGSAHLAHLRRTHVEVQERQDEAGRREGVVSARLAAGTRGFDMTGSHVSGMSPCSIFPQRTQPLGCGAGMLGRAAAGISDDRGMALEPWAEAPVRWGGYLNASGRGSQESKYSPGRLEPLLYFLASPEPLSGPWLVNLSHSLTHCRLAFLSVPACPTLPPCNGPRSTRARVSPHLRPEKM